MLAFANLSLVIAKKVTSGTTKKNDVDVSNKSTALQIIILIIILVSANVRDKLIAVHTP